MFSVKRRIRAGLDPDIQTYSSSPGRYSRQKNQRFLLYVFAELRKRFPQSRLLLVGDGEERTALCQLAAKLHVEDGVIFYGNSTQVEKLYWAMDVFAFPSLFEGLGIVAIEAQAAGLPVLCSERVPDEAFILPSAVRMSLDDGVERWVEALLSCATDRTDRSHCADDVRRAGYHADDAAVAVEAAFEHI